MAQAAQGDMGYAIPACVGVHFADPTLNIVLVIGEGSFHTNMQELAVIRKHNIPVKIFVINNDGYLSIKITQETFFGGKEIASGFDSGVTIPSLKKLCKAYGLPYISIDNNKEIDKKLEQTFNTKGPVVLELFSYPYEKHEPKVVHKGIDQNGKIIPGDLTDMFISDVFNL